MKSVQYLALPSKTGSETAFEGYELVRDVSFDMA
jgi:hypothetical protein